MLKLKMSFMFWGFLELTYSNVIYTNIVCSLKVHIVSAFFLYFIVNLFLFFFSSSVPIVTVYFNLANSTV